MLLVCLLLNIAKKLSNINEMITENDDDLQKGKNKRIGKKKKKEKEEEEEKEKKKE